jgi:hypothetical protein
VFDGSEEQPRDTLIFYASSSFSCNVYFMIIATRPPIGELRLLDESRVRSGSLLD